MKLQEALETARDCGLETAGEAIRNIEIHAGSLFSLYDTEKELKELHDTWNWIKEHRRTPDGKHPITEDTEVSLMIDYHIADDLTDYEIYREALKRPSYARKLGNER